MDLFKDKLLGAAFCFVGGLLPAMKPARMDLTGKIAIVTGSNSGVGYGLALQLAEMGATVYLACRNETRAAQAQSDMLEACPDATVKTACLDTASLASVRAFAKNWNHGPIDILAHNAGVSNSPKGKVFTEDEFEFMYQVNFLSSFLLTSLLVNSQSLANDARIIFTSSVGSYAGSLSENFAPAQTKSRVEPQFHGRGGTSNYSQSKLMQVACARAFQNHFDLQNANKRLAYSWEPGLVKSNLLRDIAGTPQDPAVWLLGKLQPLVGLDVRQGSATGVHLATSDSVGVLQHRGRYFDRMQPRAHDADGYTQEKLDLLIARWSADAEVSWTS